MTFCLWPEDPGEAPAANRLVADADTIQERSMAEVTDIELGLSSGPPPSQATPAVTNGTADAHADGRAHPLGVAKEIAPTLREFGLDPDPIIEAAGLDPRLFEDGTSVIPHRALGRLTDPDPPPEGWGHGVPGALERDPV